jgi:hypothetical protein
MIASFSRNFIFIKPRKAAGTSLEIVLSAACAGRDVCTPISPADEPLRAEFGGKPRNYKGWFGRPRFYNHMPAAEVARRLPELWRGAFKFTVERHPYEKVVSLAWFTLGARGGSPSEIAREIEATIRRKDYLNFPLYTIGGRVAVDAVWNFVDLERQVRSAAARLGLDPDVELPRAKSGIRKDRRPAAEILTGEQRRRIHDDARFEFELMNFAP